MVNALHDDNQEHWGTPIRPAFSGREVRAVVNWVKNGGSLLLIADHQPFPAAADGLASAFGFRFHNGWAVLGPLWSTDISFNTNDGSLAQHPVSLGNSPQEEVKTVVTFGGSAFQFPKEATSLLTFRGSYFSFQPADVTAFDLQTDPHVAIDGWSQGAVRSFGQGRVALFGEAGMFTAQLAGPQQEPFGFNTERADENVQLLLNLVRWLSRAEH